MKIYYFNDDKVSVRVKVMGQDYIDESVILQPAHGELFDFPAPEGSIPFVKHWYYNTVLISYIEGTIDV